MARAASLLGRARPRRAVRLAITIDDLPGGGPEIADFTHPRIVDDIVATLEAHGVKKATGFVVGSMLEGHPERRAALDTWIEAGFEVGNHTYSHRSLAELGLDGYMQDILKNRPLVDALEKRTRQTGHYFRFPYLEEGRTEAERKTLARFLAAQHYSVARVSIDFADWGWADAYGRCLQSQDTHAVDLLAQSYLENADASLVWSVAAARAVLGHSIPQVLLLHANVATANILDALLRHYEGRGVRYVSLAEALGEAVYNEPYAARGGNVLVGASHALGRPHPPGWPRPLDLLDLACRDRPAIPPLL